MHMDDFGTGLSSLSCLHQFPLHVLMIVGAYINSMSLNREYSALIMAIVTLAHNLDMEVTAEGVEHPEQIAQNNRVGMRLLAGISVFPTGSAGGGRSTHFPKCRSEKCGLNGQTGK